MLDIHVIVIAAFLMIEEANRGKFFEKIFLMANFSLKVVLAILFLILIGIDVNF